MRRVPRKPDVNDRAGAASDSVTLPSVALTQRPQWKALQLHAQQIKGLHLRDAFSADPGRAERFSAEAAGLYFDYSKNRITDETVRLLLQLAEASGLRQRVDAMFRGERINVTEQ